MLVRSGRWTARTLTLGIAGLLACLACTDDPISPATTAPSMPATGAATPDWLARAQASIAEREYRASENGTGLQAPNRRHDLRTYFSPDGIRVVDRTATEHPRLLDLKLAGVGRGTALRSVPEGTLHAEDARVEIRRPGLVEWFVNGPDGLEQGFTLADRPAGEGKLVLELRLDGARAKPRGHELIFETETGRKLSYGKLVAWDARGEPLAAEFAAVTTGRFALAIDDAHAQYPIVIDPLLAETADTVIEGEQAAALFATSVASAGDVNGDGYADVIVGAMHYDGGDEDEGAAFVFHGGPSGIPDLDSASAQTQIESDQAGARLGTSVASAGDVNGDGYADVIVGVFLYDNGQDDEGAALVFLGSASGVADGNPATAHALLESNQQDALLGDSVASAGDVNRDGFADVIVGAAHYDVGLPEEEEFHEGAAFVFLGSASGVTDGNPATAHARIEGDQPEAFLGQSVASAGDVNGDGYTDVIVGAYLYDAPENNEGAAFVFLGGASGVASGTPATAHARLESDQPNAFLGISVASAGDVSGDGYADVIVGAYAYSDGRAGEGAAFVFLGSAFGLADGIPGTANAQIQGEQDGAALGVSVASAGDVNGDGYADLIVGSQGYDGVESDGGAASIHLGGEGGLADSSPATAYARLDGDQEGVGFGSSVASAGDVNGDGYADVIVGAPLHLHGEAQRGAAFVFHGGATGIADAGPATAASRLESDQPSAEFGASVAGAGDVNGDGYGDVIVGAPSYDGGESDEGAAFVFHGGPSGIPVSASAELESDQAFARLGNSVASAGDVNGDGFADVIVGAEFYDDVEDLEGAAFVFLGSASGVANGNPASAHAQLEGDQATALLGSSVASAGDVNGDGYADVIVGARLYDHGESDEGAAFVFLGSAGGLADGSPASAHALLESDQTSAFLGQSVASAGDVNGDGYADVIVGAAGYDEGQSGEGAAFVFLGSASGLANGVPASAHARLESDQASAALGSGVASAGDVNGDGFADVIVGAIQYDDGQVDEGAAFVFLGSASGLENGNPANAHAQLECDLLSCAFGWSVASAGDVNGDGFADVIVGASAFDNPLGNEGGAFVFLGSASGVADGDPSSAHALLDGGQLEAVLGESVASAGDVNGDGFADVIVGARNYDSGQSNEGGAFVFEGGAQDGRPVLAQQLQPAGSPAVQPWGGVPGSFRISLRGTHPEGRGRVKLESEWCPMGLPFGDPGCGSQHSPTWRDVTATPAGVTLTDTIAGLTPGVAYRWRARVLHAPFAVTQPGVDPPENPSHGPWRRPTAQSMEADLRVIPEPGVLLNGCVGLAALAFLRLRRRRSRLNPSP